MFWPSSSDRRPFFIALGTLIALAWLVLLAWGESPYGRFLSHHSLEEVRGKVLLMPVFVAGWAVMVVAMMLPTSLPLVELFHRLVERRPSRAQLVGLLISGYLVVWVLFGAAVYAGDFLIHEAVDRNVWLEEHAWLLGAGTLILAGGYQFTPLKYVCLERCRSPLSFITEHWRGDSESSQAFRLGVHHGIFCIGCCWTLMLLMFAVGVGNLGWMLALAAVMATEKNMPWGRRLSAPLGAALLVGGLIAVLVSA